MWRIESNAICPIPSATNLSAAPGKTPRRTTSPRRRASAPARRRTRRGSAESATSGTIGVWSLRHFTPTGVVLDSPGSPPRRTLGKVAGRTTNPERVPQPARQRHCATPLGYGGVGRFITPGCARRASRPRAIECNAVGVKATCRRAASTTARAMCGRTFSTCGF
jgi:hypothetical protein